MSTFALKLKSYVAPKHFYKKVAFVALPITIQHLLNNMMGVVDGIMVSAINQVTAVGTALQIEMLVLTITYGVASGASIYIAQFFGSKDAAGQKKAFGFGMILSLLVALLWFLLALFFGEAIIKFYIQDPVVVENSLKYLNITMYSYFPFAILMMFSFSYRSIQKTKIPMVIGVVSMALNVIFNYILIFGHFGFPVLGIVGAAYGTLLARLIAVGFYLAYAISQRESFIGKPSEIFSFNMHQWKVMANRTYPLMINEFFFGLGSTLFIRFYGTLGTNAMDSYYVAFKLSQMFMFVVMGINAATAAILGADLGKGDLDKAKENAHHFIGLGVMLSLTMVMIIMLLAPGLVGLYQLSDQMVIDSAILIVRFFALRLALRMFNVMIFSSLRAGGDSRYLTFLDAGILWLVGLPLAYVLVYVLKLDNLPIILLIVQIEQIVRLIIGSVRVKKGSWLKNLTHELA
jgi:putative MATE family efflux protein